MATKKKAEVKKGARQQQLPGVEDNKVAVLEDKALQYAEVRDQRMSLSRKEVEFKGELLDLMKAQKRKHYKRGNIEIAIVHESENVKVKVKSSAKESDEEEPEETEEE